MHRTERAGERDQAETRPAIVLEITRGRAKHLRRVVHTSVFLIGTAADCDLVLGDLRFPEVYGYLFVSPDRVTIRRLGMGPELFVGGQTVTCAELADLDTVGMGPYEFRVLIERPQAATRGRQSQGATMETAATPIRHEWAMQRLLKDVECHAPAPRLSLFTGDGEQEVEDEKPKHTRPLGAIWRHSQRKAIS
jgi:hypothetical protein